MEKEVGGGSGGATTVVVGLDESEHSFRALDWTIRHLFSRPAPPPFELVVVHAKPNPAAISGADDAVVLEHLDSDLRRIAASVVEKAKKLCTSRSVTGVQVEVVEGDARDVLCRAVEKHRAGILVVGSHGYGAFKRAFLGSVSDHCAHHAICSVIIVKKSVHS